MVFFAVLIGGFMFGAAGSSIESIVKARVAAHKLHAVIDRKPRGGEGADVRRPVGTDLQASAVKGAIEFRDVHFSYGARPVFAGLNLHIPAGATVALVGESGCGKSTVGRLLERFYDPISGRVILDGADVSSIRIDALRAAIGVVSQEPLLFQDTIRANIAAGAVGKDASSVPLSDVVAAARAGMAHDFIASFPDGYDTVVGGKNSKLSGGQKQRIAIARAALRNPAILILDEATSALDTENERLVQDALDALVATSASRTTVVIAHRLTTVRGADKIVVLGSADAAGGMAGGGSATGSVVLEEGTHDALMARTGGRYRALVGLGGSKGGSKNASSARLSKLGDARSASEADAAALQRAIAGVIDRDVSRKDAGKDAKNNKKEAASRAPSKVNAKRIWAYSEPETRLLIVGGIVALANGCVFPAIALVFAEMLSLFYSQDTDHIMAGAVTFGSIFIGVSIASWTLSGLQGGLFAVVGERLTTRLRVHLFRAILRQDQTFFDDPANSVGALTANLRTDTASVRAATGQSLGSGVQTFGSLCFGLSVAMAASWKYGLVLLAAVPILSIGEMINMKNLASGDAAVSEAMSASVAHVGETAAMIREVKAFGLEKTMFAAYDGLLSAPRREERNKALRGAAAFGLAQSLTMLFYAFAFWYGSELISQGEIGFYDFMKALWALGFCAAGAGQAAAFAGDAAAAQTAASRIFGMIDRVPAIGAAFPGRRAARRGGQGHGSSAGALDGRRSIQCGQRANHRRFASGGKDRVRRRQVLVSAKAGDRGAERTFVRGRAGHDRRAHRPERLRQVHRRAAARAVLRPDHARGAQIAHLRRKRAGRQEGARRRLRRRAGEGRRRPDIRVGCPGRALGSLRRGRRDARRRGRALAGSAVAPLAHRTGGAGADAVLGNGA